MNHTNNILIFSVFLLFVHNGFCNEDDDSKPSVDSPLFHEFPWTSESQEDMDIFHNKTFRVNHPVGEVTSAEFTPQIPSLEANKTVVNTDVPKTAGSSTFSLQTHTTLAASEKKISSDSNVDVKTSTLPTDTTLSNINTPTELPNVAVEQPLNISDSEGPPMSQFEPAVVRLHDRSNSYAVSSPMAAATFLQPTESAAILAAVFISVALIGYIGLVVWRRVLEKRYGNRELLVNEEFYDVNDLKYFEL